MNGIAAYALLTLGGNENPSVADVERVIKGSGSQPDMAQVEALVESLQGKQFHDLISTGM